MKSILLVVLISWVLTGCDEQMGEDLAAQNDIDANLEDLQPVDDEENQGDSETGDEVSYDSVDESGEEPGDEAA